MGYRAYWDHIEKAANPYKSSSLVNSWNEGWKEAEYEFEEFCENPLMKRENNVITFVKR